ncbi:MAG: asparagine synthase (glutamine-hydrolyzing) [Mariprofundaceae bacterium]|nr:asparagine synthase (glutamine-hydrolyzing) [Mariprofundaceae bacterium]
MCGFVAVRGSVAAGELARMAEAVKQRGPDDRGEFLSGSFSAIHHRLSIIGPDERGRQPFTVDDVTVLFNGCIYNYHELRKQLEADGITFRSDSDTEVLPHLFRKFGMGMFPLLNGMFAMVIWDARNQLLVAARDPFGEKPLFVCQQGGRLGFSSSLTSFERGDWSLTPNIHAVAGLLQRMRIEAPETLYQEVSQLPAGCYGVATGGEGFNIRRYFFLPEPDQPQDMAPEEVERDVEVLLDDAFRLRMISDRPLGVFLSGGVDSSLIAASLARQVSRPLHTFAVRFAGGGPDYDESAFARTVAEHIGSEHQVLEVAADAHQVLDDLAQAFDQPVTNTAALPTWLISQAAKPYVDVALTGVGGDELFGGYPRYLGMAWHGRFRKMPGHGLVHSLVSMLGDSGSSRNLRGRLRRFLHGLELDDADAYRQWTQTTDVTASGMLMVNGNDPHNPWSSAADSFGGLSSLLARFGPVNGAMAYDLLTYLPDDLLAVGDRMSMAHALELRAPFLDTRVLSAVLTLDSTCKVTGWPWQEQLKVMLKRIAARHLPHDTVYRPKQGFMAPVKHWLHGELAGEVQALIDGKPLGGAIRPEFVREQWQRHRQGEDRSDILWGLLLVDRWMQKREWRF